MKLYLEEKFAHYQKLIENSNVVSKKIKDKLTNLDVYPTSVTASESTGSMSMEQC